MTKTLKPWQKLLLLLCAIYFLKIMALVTKIGYFHCVEFVLMMFVILSLTIWRPTKYVLFLAALCNLMAIITNKGLMPVDPSKAHPETMQGINSTFDFYSHSIATSETHLWFFIDRFQVLTFLTVSIGDIILAAGILMLMIEIVVRPKNVL